MKKRMIGVLLASVLVSCLLWPVGVQSAEPQQNAVESKAPEKQNVRTFSGQDGLSDLPTAWDLTDLYADEEAFEKDMTRAEELISVYESFRGTLNSAEGLLAYMESPELLELTAILDSARMYTEFLSALNPTDAWATKANARFREVTKKKGLASGFVSSEIMSMPLETRQEILADERLAPYAYYLREYIDPNHVVLSEEADRVKTLLDSAAFSSEDIHNTFDYAELPRPSFTYPDGTEGILTDAACSQIMSSSKYPQEFKNEIFMLRNAMRAPYASTYTAMLDSHMKAFWAEAQIYGYDSALAYKLHGDDVDPEIYGRIIQFAHETLGKMHEYFAAKLDYLGLEATTYNIEASSSDYEMKSVSYEDAVNIGRNAISLWGDEYLATFDKIITSPHIDVYPSDHKQTGAFEYLAGNQTTPFVLYNFDGLESYISTIVHEMGHAVYSEFAAENQNEFNNNPGIFTQEVASTANEIMFYKKMVEEAPTEGEKIYWLEREINLFWDAIYSQCLYSEFEDYCYKTVEAGGSLSANALAEKWLELSATYYGERFQFPEEYGIDWARIPHMYYNYYVYKYATSLTYASSVCEQVQENGQEEIDRYIEFLKAGGSTDPANLLRIAGIDPLDDATYKAAGAYISGLIDEYISLLSKQSEAASAEKNN